MTLQPKHIEYILFTKSWISRTELKELQSRLGLSCLLYVWSVSVHKVAVLHRKTAQEWTQWESNERIMSTEDTERLTYVLDSLSPLLTDVCSTEWSRVEYSTQPIFTAFLFEAHFYVVLCTKIPFICFYFNSCSFLRNP